MKAVRVSRFGGPDVLEFQTVVQPKPGPGQVLVDVEVAGVNFIDTYHREGLYPLDLPFTPGIEAAGKVAAVGKGVEEFRPGERVVYTLAVGSYAEKALVEDWKVVHLPKRVSAEAGVTAMCQGMTAHYLISDCYRLSSGDWALVHAAAGGVGLLLVQMAKLVGAKVIGTVSNEKKAALAREAGADYVVNYSQEDFEESVAQVTEGKGVHVVYESVGKATFQKSLNCLRPRGYLVLFGQSSGPVDPLDPQVLNQKGSIFLTRPSLFHYASNRSEFLKRARGVLELIESGEVKVTIGETLPLSAASEAHRRLEGRATFGKVLLAP